MDVDDDNGAAPMLVEPRPAEDRLQPMSDELDGDGAPSTDDGVLLLPRGLFDALDDDVDAAADFPSRRRETMLGDASDDESVDSLLDSDSDSEDDVACWALDSVRLFREQDQWTSSFVLFFLARPHVGRAGPRAPRPSGSERSSSRPSCSPCTVTPTSSSYPACRTFSPALIRSSQSNFEHLVSYPGKKCAYRQRAQCMRKARRRRRNDPLPP